jgi:hypothetical protein
LANEKSEFCSNNIVIEIILASRQQGVLPLLFVRNPSGEEERATLTLEILAGGKVVALAVIEDLRVQPSEELCLEIPLTLPHGDYAARIHISTRAGCERELHLSPLRV